MITTIEVLLFFIILNILYSKKPLFAFHQDGTVKTFGISLDENMKQKAIFIPVVVACFGVVFYQILIKRFLLPF